MKEIKEISHAKQGHPNFAANVLANENRTKKRKKILKQQKFKEIS